MKNVASSIFIICFCFATELLLAQIQENRIDALQQELKSSKLINKNVSIRLNLPTLEVKRGKIYRIKFDFFTESKIAIPISYMNCSFHDQLVSLNKDIPIFVGGMGCGKNLPVTKFVDSKTPLNLGGPFIAIKISDTAKLGLQNLQFQFRDRSGIRDWFASGMKHNLDLLFRDKADSSLILSEVIELNVVP